MSFEYSGLIFRQSCLSLAKCAPHLTKTHVGVFTFVDFAYCASIVTCPPAYGTTWSSGGILIKWIVKTRKKQQLFIINPIYLFSVRQYTKLSLHNLLALVVYRRGTVCKNPVKGHYFSLCEAHKMHI